MTEQREINSGLFNQLPVAPLSSTVLTSREMFNQQQEGGQYMFSATILQQQVQQQEQAQTLMIGDPRLFHSSFISDPFNSTTKSVRENNNANRQGSTLFNQQEKVCQCDHQQQQQVQVEQQLQVLAKSPFGDSPLFRTSVVEVKTSIYLV